MSNLEGIKNQPPQNLEGDDLSGMSEEQKKERIAKAWLALCKVLRQRARAIIDANPASFTQKH